MQSTRALTLDEARPIARRVSYALVFPPSIRIDEASIWAVLKELEVTIFDSYPGYRRRVIIVRQPCHTWNVYFVFIDCPQHDGTLRLINLSKDSLARGQVCTACHSPAHICCQNSACVKPLCLNCGVRKEETTLLCADCAATR